jgi:hypothetical protein
MLLISMLRCEYTLSELDIAVQKHVRPERLSFIIICQFFYNNVILRGCFMGLEHIFQDIILFSTSLRYALRM